MERQYLGSLKMPKNFLLREGRVREGSMVGEQEGSSEKETAPKVNLSKGSLPPSSL